MLFHEIFGKAIFVMPDKACVSPCFFGKFHDDASKKSKIVICGLGFFRLYINGKRVSGDVFAPVTSFYHAQKNCYCTEKFGEEMKGRIYAVKYDISPYVRGGENEIAVVTGPGWYGEFSDNCVLAYKITSGDMVTYSDEKIEWAPSPLVGYDIHKGEMQDYPGGDFDLCGLPRGQRRQVVKANIPETEFYVQDCPNDRVMRSITPRKIKAAEGYSVYDAGENISGTVVFSCGAKGKKITLSVSEAVLDDGNIDDSHSYGQTATFVVDGAPREYGLMFTWHAFRYFKIDSAAQNVRVDVIHSDISVTADFKCENPVLNWLFEAYIRTQLCNMHAGIPSDCPHIERRGYTGDGQLTCETVMLTTDAEKFYLKWMEDISDCQDIHSGHVQYTAPYFRCGGGPGGWGCAIAEVPYKFYKMYGDISPMKKYFPQMLKYLDYLEAHSENDLVVSDQPGLWCLGEWCVPGEKQFSNPDIPAPFVNTYFYIRTIDRMIELADLCGASDVIDNLKNVRARKVKAINLNYFNAETGDYCSNINSANAFALDVGLGDGRTFDNLLAAVRKNPLDTGIFGTELVVKLLFERGYFDDAVSLLSRESYPSFGYMKSCGATTLWEEWKNPRSMSHPMFGAAVKYLFYNILGIRQEEGSTAFEKLVIEPKTNAVTGNVSGHITTTLGKVSVSVDAENRVCTVISPKKSEVKIIYPAEIHHIKY